MPLFAFYPALTVNESVAAIRAKFGAPQEEYLPVAGSPIPASTQLIYQTSYGELSFWFNENGRLGRIDMQANRLGPT